MFSFLRHSMCIYKWYETEILDNRIIIFIFSSFLLINKFKLLQSNAITSSKLNFNEIKLNYFNMYDVQL